MGIIVTIALRLILAVDPVKYVVLSRVVTVHKYLSCRSGT